MIEMQIHTCVFRIKIPNILLFSFILRSFVRCRWAASSFSREFLFFILFLVS